MRPNEMRFVTVESLIPEEHRRRRDWGGMSLSYTGNLMEMWAQIALRGGNRGGSADVTFSVLNGAGSDVQEAVWQQPRPGKAVIALGNSSNEPIQTTLQFTDGETEEVNIAPFGTGYVRRNSGGNSNDKKYTSGIRFYDTLNTFQPNLFATNFRVKNYSPRLLLKNTSNADITTQASFRPTAGDGATIELPVVTLAVGEIKELDLQPLRAAAAARDDLDSVGVQASTAARPAL